MKHLMILAAFLAGGTHAEASCVTAADAKVTSADGSCWQASSGPQRLALRFGFDAATLGQDERQRLDAFAARVEAEEAGELVVTAHSDRLGDPRYNLTLSARRADAVRAYLEEKGVPPGAVRVEARGAGEPVTGGRCSGLGEESRRNERLVACLAPDRRVEVRAGTILAADRE